MVRLDGETHPRRAFLSCLAPWSHGRRDTEKHSTTHLGILHDFAKLDLRVAEVVECKKAEKSDKLLVLQLKVGDTTRQVISGIAQHYTPDQLVGKFVVLVSNLKPVKLRGILSEGMILCADNGKEVVFVTPEKTIESGSKVK